MLAAMATVTSGLLSPNSYGLNPDQAENVVESEYNRYRGGGVPIFSTNVDSSDSDENVFQMPKDQTPKRNKRKNFEPRCTNLTYSDTNQVLNLSEFSNNNNLKNVRRRKTLATRKVVVDTRHSPMDLSKNNESDSDTDASGDFTENETMENYEDDNSSENDNKIPSSFSIHNLSKPHISDGGGGGGLSHGQVSDMREYAFNTMRELLGIYGLTSEVAESISRQLPIAAFSSGEYFARFFEYD
ncbi:hypothetical protein FQA39_LY15934 [Lamprigera yunnana]|nr:hypothetical protein FQA39_LY15934 [Lamprigera yunnana]